MKKRIIAAICLVAMLVSMTTLGALQSSAASVWIDKEIPKDLNYSFAVLGDIQSLTFFDTHQGTTYLADMFDWILDNKEERKIEYIFGLGDTVDTLTTYPNSARNPREWIKARSQINRLYDSEGNAIIPFTIVRGNHDDEKGYHKHICTENYQNQIDGFFYDPEKPLTLGNSMSNSYRKIQIGGHKYLMLGLDYHADDSVIEWANQVISENPDYKVIVSIHAYLNSSGMFEYEDIGSSNVDDTELVWKPFRGQNLWNKIFRQHENVFMVLSGHVAVNTPVVNTRTGLNGNEVIEILVDPQGIDERLHADGKAGAFVLMLNITNGGEKLEIEYYSTAYGQFYGGGNQRVITLPEGTLPDFELPLETTTATTEAAITTELTTAAETTTAQTTVAPPTRGCSAAISTTAVACSIGTSLAVFAMRRRKED